MAQVLKLIDDMQARKSASSSCFSPGARCMRPGQRPLGGGPQSPPRDAGHDCHPSVVTCHLVFDACAKVTGQWEYAFKLIDDLQAENVSPASWSSPWLLSRAPSTLRRRSTSTSPCRSSTCWRTAFRLRGPYFGRSVLIPVPHPAGGCGLSYGGSPVLRLRGDLSGRCHRQLRSGFWLDDPFFEVLAASGAPPAPGKCLGPGHYRTLWVRAGGLPLSSYPAVCVWRLIVVNDAQIVVTSDLSG